MRLDLLCHSSIENCSVAGITLRYIWQTADQLRLEFQAEGDVDLWQLPDPVLPQRCDNLWRTSCFELFAKDQSTGEYCEFNFSPSRQWAAYQFLDYRKDMQDMTVPTPPVITRDQSLAHFTLNVELRLPAIWSRRTLQANFSAIIAEKDGTQSFWALNHPPGKPDFHHRDCFTHQLKAAEHL
ncbi:MAG: DOMON-like domain-containing protein [Parasphingorhabdus sp.]|uniref:DOMON-like domain-containing protein n=1 Tax=Parasphingorhabdus sp. TaxID=2709688 RepID=UPI003297ACF5